MGSGTQIFFSHRVENLFERLREHLFIAGQHPFARRMVVVPSPAMKSWLQFRLASDPNCGIAAGLEVVYIDQAMRSLNRIVHASDKREPTILELALIVEYQIFSVLKDPRPIWDPLKQFLGGVTYTRKLQRRVTNLAWQLARLFEKYGVYGGDLLAEWQQHPKDWQQSLWQRVWAEYPQFSFRHAMVEEALKSSFDPLLQKHVEVHLFSTSFLPALTHRFLSQISQSVPVNYYVLSPCQAFWSDIKSDRECRNLYTFWKQKGASQGQLMDLEQFLSDRNPLLANFGRLGREMAEQLEVGDHETFESYSIPKGLARIDAYEALLSDDVVLEECSLSLLSHVQADLTLLRNPMDGEKISRPADDTTIQVHVCANRRREVENIYNVLMHCIRQHSEGEKPIHPSDIVVMAPDLTDYEPYIKMVFGDAQSALDYQLMEVEVLTHSSFVQAFMKMLELATSRWDAASLLQFMELPSVQLKHCFKGEDLRKFREWVEAAGIRWGDDAEHCTQMLQRDLCAKGLVDEGQPGTWAAGIDRLLAGLAFTGLQGETLEHLSPLELIDSSGSELLGRWIEFLRALRADIKPLQDGTLLSVERWAVYLKALIEAYLAVENGDREGQESRVELFKEVDALGRAGVFVDEHRVPFATILTYLEEGLHAKRINYREGHLQAVRFCSMLPMRAMPGRVIVLLGMQDGVFPKGDQDSGLDMLRSSVIADYVPRRGDFDRSLFLEALLSARQYFILSYTRYHEGKVEAPSVLINELLVYLDAAYEIGDKKPSESIVQTHPLHGYDKYYFREDALFPNYSERLFKAAKAYYLEEKAEAHTFIPDFTKLPKLVAKDLRNEALTVDLKELLKMAKNPLQAYFNKTLGMYVNGKAKRLIEEDETFYLDNLDAYTFKKKGLEADESAVIRSSIKEGIFPSGLFKEIALEKVKKEIGIIDSSLETFGIKKDEIEEMLFTTSCDKPVRGKNGWICPPIEIQVAEGPSFQIVGKLSDVSSKGLLLQKSMNFESLVEVWPRYLAFSYAVNQNALPLETNLLFLKDGKALSLEGIDLLAAFQGFLEYYMDALQQVSPLLPAWVKAVMDGDKEKLDGALKKALGPFNQHFYNEYAKWCFVDMPDAENILAHWQETAHSNYHALSTLLSSKAKGQDE